jgi:hypothetical protein
LLDRGKERVEVGVEDMCLILIEHVFVRIGFVSGEAVEPKGRKGGAGQHQ